MARAAVRTLIAPWNAAGWEGIASKLWARPANIDCREKRMAWADDQSPRNPRRRQLAFKMLGTVAEMATAHAPESAAAVTSGGTRDRRRGASVQATSAMMPHAGMTTTMVDAEIATAPTEAATNHHGDVRVVRTRSARTRTRQARRKSAAYSFTLVE